MSKDEGKELSREQLDAEIKQNIEQIGDYLTTLGAILSDEGNDVNLNSVWDLAVAKMKEQLVGPGVDEELTKEEMEELVEKGFAREVIRELGQNI